MFGFVVIFEMLPSNQQNCSRFRYVENLKQRDQMARFFVNIRPFTTMKFAQWHQMLTKSGSNICPTLNKPSQVIAQDF